jgi:protein-L-isoaspartate(D-aspartate) O-methyltransferase
MAELAALRANLVDQVRAHARAPISDAVAGALRAVPRHLFLPQVPAQTAYQDEAIVTKLDGDGVPISSSSQPTIMALMLDQLSLAPGQRVLEIGAGTGYNAALMSRLVGPSGHVVSVDIDQDLVDQARLNLANAGYPQVSVVRGDGADGHAIRAPYDRVIATVGVWDLAPAWLDQLAPDGRIVVPLDLGGLQRSVALERADGHWVSRSVVPCGFMRLRGAFAGPERLHQLGGGLSLVLPDGGDIDQTALLTALAQPPSRVPTGVTATPRDLFFGVGLWLTINGLSWCVLSAPVPGPLPFPLVRVQELGYTAGIIASDGLAVLANEPGPDSANVINVLGYGPAGEQLATRLAGHARAWVAAGQPGSNRLHIDVYPKSTPDGALTGRHIFDKTHTRLAVSWPSVVDPPPASI